MCVPVDAIPKRKKVSLHFKLCLQLQVCSLNNEMSHIGYKSHSLLVVIDLGLLHHTAPLHL